MNDMTMIHELEAYMNAHEAELVEDIMTLCRINSVKAEPQEGKPYGAGAHAALMKAKELCERYGLTTNVYADRVIAADLNAGEACLDILAHMDVVAPGDGWTKTEAFEPLREGDAIYGRGTSDDKGPAMAALYAIRAIRELGITLKGRCRLLLGSDEECGSSDIPHYYAVEPEAPMTFSPDAEFPVTNIEKGQFRATVTAAWNDAGNDTAANGAPAEQSATANGAALKAQARALVKAESGDTLNIVPGKGYALVRGFTKEELENAAAAVREALFENEHADDFAYRITEEDDVHRIAVTGKTAHASLPEGGVNAALVLLQILGRLQFADAEMNRSLAALAEFFPYGDHYGAGLGVALSDEESGKTTLSADILKIEANRIELRFDARTCVYANEENTIRKAAATLEAAGFHMDYSFNPPHKVSGDSAFVKTLLEQYTLVTGKPGRCVAIGGGSYVHGFKNGVTFGAVGETTDTHMHGADEFVLISEMKQAAVIYAMAIAKLCG